jgi:hypothetical protein
MKLITIIHKNKIGPKGEITFDNRLCADDAVDITLQNAIPDSIQVAHPPRIEYDKWFQYAGEWFYVVVNDYNGHIVVV